MRDRTRIVIGLGAFLALAAFPLWNALGTGGDPARPTLERATDSSGCVEDTLYMAAHHEELLNAWRTAWVTSLSRTMRLQPVSELFTQLRVLGMLSTEWGSGLIRPETGELLSGKN